MDQEHGTPLRLGTSTVHARRLPELEEVRRLEPEVILDVRSSFATSSAVRYRRRSDGDEESFPHPKGGG